MTSSRRRAAERVLRSISLHAPEYAEYVELDSTREYLEGLFPTVEVKVEPDIFALPKRKELAAIAVSLAKARVKDPSKAHQSFEPMYGEIEFEKRAAAGGARVGGVVYDGRELEDILASILPRNDFLKSAHIILTQRLIATYSHDDLRHHLRTVVCGFPSIISIPGIVEAPAKPREFYVLKQELEARGAGELELHKLKSAFKGRFVDYGDPEMNEVLKGLALQAVLFHLTLDPFCNNPKCRLFNAHWQEDLVRSQIREGGLCERHQGLLRRLGKHAAISW